VGEALLATRMLGSEGFSRISPLLREIEDNLMWMGCEVVPLDEDPVPLDATTQQVLGAIRRHVLAAREIVPYEHQVRRFLTRVEVELDSMSD
jgi:hypothetical protein